MGDHSRVGLHLLHPKSKAAKVDALRVDIVAVHGLEGHPINTWTLSDKSDTLWLRDFLPSDVHGARIFTFGYEADVAFGKSIADIKDHAMDLLGSLIDVREEQNEISRPIIFIAHSLGGIVAKQALAWARVESRYQQIKDHTLGIVFFGTPHRGSDFANYGQILAKVVNGVMRHPDSTLVKALQTNSNELLRLASEFRFLVPKYQILTLYETKPTKGSSCIVEKHSALLDTVEEDSQPVNADHNLMCKFGSRDDNTYRKLVARLNRWLKPPSSELGSEHFALSTSRNKYYEVPFSPSPFFTGREDIVQELNRTCSPTEPIQLQSIQKRFVLHGLGGSGKTQVCLKFAQSSREKYAPLHLPIRNEFLPYKRRPKQCSLHD
ncbi:MAG: hypothetical protein Q9222_004627 [Ikaeria aurantiellina]